ncbi:MAG: regulatory signaling modulator protein AmpE [Gammaproteobacteria bacterium]|nr:regulatory signaling modulator protein AmpE [Gammaproteobacteria bacterium]
MEFIIILLVLALQRFMKLGSGKYQFDWMTPYYNWLRAKVNYVGRGHPLVELVIIVVPVLLALAIVIALISLLSFKVGYFVVLAVLLWYCIDGRDLSHEPYPDSNTQTTLLTVYRKLFAVLFWFALFGPIGLALYVSVEALINCLQSHDEPGELLDFSIKTQAVFDWLPIRLVGLAFALVGHFTVVFKVWLPQVWQGLKDSPNLILSYAMAALCSSKSSDESTPNSELANVDQAELIKLIDRALLVWLVLMLILTVHAWLS